MTDTLRIYPTTSTFALSASVSVVTFRETSRAAITGAAVVHTVKGSDGKQGNVTVETDINNTTTAVAAAAAAGIGALAGGVAVAVNKADIQTYIGQGVTVVADGTVSVRNTSDITARTYLVGASFGGISLTICAAVTNLKPVIFTFIGTAPEGCNAVRTTAATNGEIQAKNLSVDNDVTSNATSFVLSISGGIVGMAGNVLVVLNNTKSVACVGNMKITLSEDVWVQSVNESASSSVMSSLVAGAIAIGTTVSVVKLGYENVAQITGSNITARNLYVKTSREITAENGSNSSEKKSSALAKAFTVSGALGAVAVGVNVAVADNKEKNIAQITGNGNLVLTGNMQVKASLDAKADARMYGLNVAAFNVAVGVVRAYNRAENQAMAEAGSAEAASASVTAEAGQDTTIPKKADRTGVWLIVGRA